MKTIKRILCMLLAFTMLFTAAAPKAGAVKAGFSVTVDGSKAKTPISDRLFGIFFEDISYAADGGLSSNLIFNNSFEFSYVENQSEELKWRGWSVESGNAAIEYEHVMSDNNPSCLRVDCEAVVTNCGYADDDSDYGIFIKKDERYALSFYADMGSHKDSVKLEFINAEGESCVAPGVVIMPSNVKPGFRKYSTTFIGTRTDCAQMRITVQGESGVYLDFFSLVPQSSHGIGDSRWKYSSLRTNLYDALAQLEPAFVRFPGGCVAEGTLDWDYAYNWKKTIGPLEERVQIPNMWGYNQSMSVGFYEYFLLCEDLKALAVPVVHAGLMCQARGNTNYMPLDSDEFAQHIRDVLDLIEYANGAADTAWGGVRASNGHPEPFGLEYIAIGNENWNEEYFERFDAIYNAVKAEYPEITVITSAGPSAGGESFEYAWNLANTKYTDTVVDEHYYVQPNWLIENVRRYDSYDRAGAKVFVGEYAAHRGGGNGITKSNFQTAIAEAAYMTGLERNGDVVELASYAPLFSRLNHIQWTPNLIWFTTDRVVRTTSYYVQQLFMKNTGTQLVDTRASFTDDDGLFCVSSEDENGVLYVKVVNTTAASPMVSLNIEGYDYIGSADMLCYGSGLYNQGNTFENNEFFTPRQMSAAVISGKITKEIGPYSVNVFRVSVKRGAAPAESGYRRGTTLEVKFFELLANFVIEFKKTALFTVFEKIFLKGD